ncbi:MAG TPA: TMEM175 family protein [Chthoniobacterales bacterium]|nr:TMEM175 family protein [Chthoniobacterales bacterium]
MAGAPHPKKSRDLPGFRWRGHEVTRLEGFSDAVFGFALTLLVVSLDVPRTFDDLVLTMRGFPAFAICFLFLALIWNGHYKFCRRYGLDDGTARFLTCVMLFLVLFYVYPLKFLFNLSITSLLLGGAIRSDIMSASQFSALLMIYGLGFAAVYLAMGLLYLHAYRLRDELELTELERFDTRYQIFRMAALVAVGLIAALLACIPVVRNVSSLVYILLFPILRISRSVHRRRRAPYLAALADE